MLAWLEYIEKVLSENIVKLLESGNVIIGGVGAIAVSALTCWALYRTFMIMAGMSSEPLLPLIKDFLLKSFILTVATSSSLYFSFFTEKIHLRTK